MNRFTYFLPGAPGCNTEMLSARGLLARFSAPGGILEHAISPWREGPAGHGVALAVTCEPVIYQPETQLWMDCGRYWLGCDNNAKPGPIDLEREIGYSGHELQLLDGNDWRVPLLRRWNAEKMQHESSLPKVLRPCKGEGGRYAIKPCVALQHEPLDALAESIWQAFLTEMKWQTELLFSTAVQLLAENYRIATEEAGLLGLLDESNALRVLGLSIDTPGLEAGADNLASHGLHFAEDRFHG